MRVLTGQVFNVYMARLELVLQGSLERRGRDASRGLVLRRLGVGSRAHDRRDGFYVPFLSLRCDLQ